MCWIFISENIFETFGTEYQRQIPCMCFSYKVKLFNEPKLCITTFNQTLHHCTTARQETVLKSSRLTRSDVWLLYQSQHVPTGTDQSVHFTFPRIYFHHFQAFGFFFWPLRWRTAVGKFPPENSELSVFDRLYIFIYMWLCIFLCLCSSFTDLVDASWSADSTSYQLANWRHS